jgi:predicted acetyltransferase
VFINSSAGNIASEKVIINNNGEFIKEDNGSKYFKITL